MKLPSRILAIDLEATGTDPARHSICQIGAVIVGRDFSQLGTFMSYVKPYKPEFDPEAMKIHGLTREFLERQPEIGQVLADLEDTVKKTSGNIKVVPASWGGFDIGFTRAAYEVTGRKWPYTYRSFDIKSAVIWELSKLGVSQWGGLDTCLEAVGMKFDGAQHDALWDIINTVRIMRFLANRFDSNVATLETVSKSLKSVHDLQI